MLEARLFKNLGSDLDGFRIEVDFPVAKFCSLTYLTANFLD
jgi:hypothetical protein